MSMGGKKQFWFIFLRTLAVFLAFWLLMAVILSCRNKQNLTSTMEASFGQSVDFLSQAVPQTLESDMPEQDQWSSILWYLSSYCGSNGIYMGVTRLLDEGGQEIARAQMSLGRVNQDVGERRMLYILFDEVLDDREQVELARRLSESEHDLTAFWGKDNGFYTSTEDLGLYGEVTGIQDGNIIYPQKLVYYYEDEAVTVMESGHTMFENEPLTVIRFDRAAILSTLTGGDLTPEKNLELYRHSNETIDRLTGSKTATNVVRADSIFRATGGGWYYSSQSPLAYAYSYFPWQVATHGLGFIYVVTLLAALLAARWVSRMQIKSLKRERQFTRAVAHELKTPAAVLRAYAEALSEDAVPEKRREYLDAIVEESDRMAGLVNELLDLSRLDGAKVTLTREPVDLTALVRECFERLRVPMEERNLELELALEPVTVDGDPRRLERVAGNLAVNALRHASPGPVRAALKRENGRAVLTVENRCPAIPPEQLKRLWEPFAKGDESRSGEGSGLGLAVVRNIVALHGGSCGAKSTPDGIYFYVELP